MFAPVYFIGVLDFILHAADDPRVLYRYMLLEEVSEQADSVPVMTSRFEV